MAPAAISPASMSGTGTPTTESASALTQAGIKHALPSSYTLSSKLAPLDASKMTVQLTDSPRAVPHPESGETKAQVWRQKQRMEDTVLTHR
jgi:branched-chain amino acid aminotransferase